MVEIEGQSGPSSFPPASRAHRVRLEIPERVAEAALDQGASASSELRARIRTVADRAEAVQLAACRLTRAIDALEAIEQGLFFALEAAREALQAQTLPEEAVRALQSQVDLALGGVDWESTHASFGGLSLFTGSLSIECGEEKVDLPALSTASLGGSWVTSMAAEYLDTGEIEYSQSVASVIDGGPNCLEQHADGAVMALSAGIEHVRALRDELQGFNESMVLPAAGEIAVALANVIASRTTPESLSEAAALLEDMTGEITGDMAGGQIDGRGLLELLG